MKIIIKTIISIAIMLSNITGYARNDIERRVYYLDCSYSMVSNNLWDNVRTDLKKAITAIKDERTEIVVIPFAVDGNQSYTSLKAIEQKANKNGKEIISNYIDNLKPQKSSMTYHKLTLQDFYNNKRWKSADRLTYMFIMTDGKDEDRTKHFVQELKKWKNVCGTNIYGFYVKLCPEAEYYEAENVIKNIDNFEVITSANINLNLIRIENSAIFNSRNDEFCEVKIKSGEIDRQNLNITPINSKNYKYIKYEIDTQSKKIKFRIKSNTKNSDPEKLILNLTYKSKDNLDVLITKKIAIECKYIKEQTVKIKMI